MRQNKVEWVEHMLVIAIYIYHVLACLPQHICPGSSRSNVQRSASLRQNGSWPVGPQPGRGVSQRKTSSSTTGVNLGSAAGGVSPLIRLRRLHTSGLPDERPRATRALRYGRPKPPTLGRRAPKNAKNPSGGWGRAFWPESGSLISVSKSIPPPF